MASEVREQILELEAAKRRIVEEAEALLDVLDAPGPDGTPGVGLKGPLVDREGFPRADVDIFAIRKHRNRLAILRTDRKELEAKIEAKLHELHALQEPEEEERPVRGKAAGAVAATVPDVVASPVAPAAAQRVEDLVPIAVVNDVMAGSPAATAGLAVGDRILTFGAARREAGARGESGNPLNEVAAETSKNFGEAISVTVLRDDKRVQLQLTPQAWDGRGALGCHLLPIQD